MKKKSLVLLSGGLDSVVNFAVAYEKTDVELILTFDYGQEAVDKEIKSSRMIAQKYKILHHIIPLDFLSSMNSSLTGGHNRTGKIPDFDKNKLDDKEYSLKTARAVWVPNRNGIFLSIAAAYADSYSFDEIVTGFNKEEGKTFPDNSKDFIKISNQAFKLSTMYHPIVKSYTADKTKSEIVKMGKDFNAPFEYVWSCYHGGKKMCGKCESCQRLIRALEANDFLEEFKKINMWGIL